MILIPITEQLCHRHWVCVTERELCDEILYTLYNYIFPRHGFDLSGQGIMSMLSNASEVTQEQVSMSRRRCINTFVYCAKLVDGL